MAGSNEVKFQQFSFRSLRWGQFLAKGTTFSLGLSLYFMCSDQHIKYQMLRGFLLTCSLPLDYHVKQYTHTHTLLIIDGKIFNLSDSMVAVWKRYKTDHLVSICFIISVLRCCVTHVLAKQ